MNETVKALALAYAACLVEFHEVNELVGRSPLRENQAAVRRAYEELVDAQNRLDDAARKSVQ